MNTKYVKERIEEAAAHEQRNPGSSITNSSVSESSSQKFGLGKKCLIVFAAAVVASLIVHQLPDAYKRMGGDPALADTWLAKTAGILGGAAAFFLMAMVIAAFVRGGKGVITGVGLVGLWAYLSSSGELHKPEVRGPRAAAENAQKRTASARPDLPQPGQSFLWKPAGSDYSVVFPDSPIISEVRGHGDGGEVTCLQATHSGTDDFEQAQFFERAADTSTSKEVVTAALLNWARVNGIQYAQVEFSDNNLDDIVVALKGAKPISTKRGDTTILYRGETHYSPRSVMITLIGASASKDPTPEGLAFLQSIRLER